MSKKILDSVYFPLRKEFEPYYAQYELEPGDVWTYANFFEAIQDPAMSEDRRRFVFRWLLENDLFLCIYYILGRTDINAYDKPFLIERCKEVQSGPMTDTVDLWARGHYKSTIITQGLTIQRLLKIPDNTIGIFSFNKNLAISFTRPIKTSLEDNLLVKYLWPDRVWDHPRRDAPAWSYEAGFILKRRSESNTCSLEACGLVEGMPTGKHFAERVYDDVITEKTVYTPDQIQKAKEAFKMSDNLSTADGGCQRIVGTIYDNGDYYSDLVREEQNGIYPWHIRIHPWFDRVIHAEKRGIKVPVFLDVDTIKAKQIKQGPYLFACQMELDPSNEENQEFRTSWLQRYSKLPNPLNLYLFVDPANEKNKRSDWSAYALIGICALDNRYLVDLVRDKLNLEERWQMLKLFKEMYPECHVWYEKYGLQSDIGHFKWRMKTEGVYFSINEMGGQVPKKVRIRRMMPVCKNGRFFLPENGIFYKGEDLVRVFIDQEYRPFPYPPTFDMFDAISRVEDPEIGILKPKSPKAAKKEQEAREQFLHRQAVSGW